MAMAMPQAKNPNAQTDMTKMCIRDRVNSDPVEGTAFVITLPYVVMEA